MTLQIDKVQRFEDVLVYGDSNDYFRFYVLPSQARYRRMPDGSLAFKFLKYRFPIDRGPDQPEGGGYLMFDTEFVVDEEKLGRLMQELQTQVRNEANRRNEDPVPDVIIGDITWTKGSVKIQFPDNPALTPKQHNPPAPSLYGNNIATFGIELTPEGATFFEQAMQGSGGVVGVIYDLHHYARLPAVTVTASFHASRFYSFYQTIDTEWRLWDEDEYRETVREQMISSESMSLEIDDGGGAVPEDVLEEITSWAMRTLEEAVERNMIEAIAPVPDDQREKPDGIEDVTRNISNTQISSFTLRFTQAMTVEWRSLPQGILQNITSLKDGDGNPVKWEDYAQTIDLDDPFFRQLRVDTFVNADFDDLPIHSVEVKVLYDGRPMPNLIEGLPEGEAIMKKPDDMGKFATFVENDNWEYTYSYQINYEGESRIFQSEEITTNEGNLTMGVSDIGILTVDVSAGDLNWSDVERALVTFEYEDSGADVELFKDQFQLTKDSTTHRVQEVIFAPMRKNYRYNVKYFMKNGVEIQGDEIEDRSERLFINDVFSSRKDISIRGIGDFDNKINKIFVDLRYTDEDNDYKQEESYTLSADVDSHSWSFPVITRDGGKVEYKAQIVYKDGTTEDIDWTEPDSNTILLPPPTEDFIEVDVVPDLLDFSVARLVRVDLKYADPDNNILEDETFLFSASRSAGMSWRVEIRDRQKNRYTYKSTYFLASGGQVVDGPHETDTTTLILEVPA